MKVQAKVTCKVSISDVSHFYVLTQFLAVNSFSNLSRFTVFYKFLAAVTLLYDGPIFGTPTKRENPRARNTTTTPDIYNRAAE